MSNISSCYTKIHAGGISDEQLVERIISNPGDDQVTFKDLTCILHPVIYAIRPTRDQKRIFLLVFFVRFGFFNWYISGGIVPSCSKVP